MQNAPVHGAIRMQSKALTTGKINMHTENHSKEIKASEHLVLKSTDHI